MDDVKKIIGSIFFDIIERFNFTIHEENDRSILYKNEFCYLFVGHHNGESYVHIKLEEAGRIIIPLNWGMKTRELDFGNILPIQTFDPNTNTLEILKYSWAAEKALISLFCSDLLGGDFSKLNKYLNNTSI